MHWIRSEIAKPAASLWKPQARTAAMPHDGGAADDLRLFATTFAAGFLFVFLVIA